MTHDEAHRIAATLAALPPGAGALVYDAQSGDATVALARAAGARAIVAPWCGFVAARRAALAAVTTPWTFMLDADERLDATALVALGLVPDDGPDGYAIARATRFCGRTMRGCGWGDDAPLRLFRTAAATLEAHPVAGGTAELHETWHVAGSAGRLAGTLEHDSYPTLRDYGRKFARYTAIEAAGIPGSPGRVVRAAARAVVRAPWLYLGRGGWRDGWRGAFVAAASAAYPVVVAWRALR